MNRRKHERCVLNGRTAKKHRKWMQRKYRRLSKFKLRWKNGAFRRFQPWYKAHDIMELHERRKFMSWEDENG